MDTKPASYILRLWQVLEKYSVIRLVGAISVASLIILISKLRVAG